MIYYRIEWEGGQFTSREWGEIVSHPQFTAGTLFEYIPGLGFVAI